ncbi:hypothetical protein L0F63_006912, partial [Massospora cicadina]
GKDYKIAKGIGVIATNISPSNKPMKYLGKLWETSSHSTQLLIVAILASALTATSILTFQGVGTGSKRKDEDEEQVLRKVRSLNALGIDKKHDYGTEFEISEDDSEVLIEEQLSRNSTFLGGEGMAKLRRAKVIIVGAGGVGSWAAVMLARSGVFQIRVIDFDQVTLSSLNRHASATREDVGIPKVIAIKRHIKRFAPSVKVDARMSYSTLFRLRACWKVRLRGLWCYCRNWNRSVFKIFASKVW